MNWRGPLVGEPGPRRRVLALAICLPALASAAFLLEFDAVVSLGWLSLYAALVLAVYAGWSRAGAIVGCGAVFFAILWRFVVPPAVGYWRWSWDARYVPPRFLGYKLDPRGEFVEGLTNGPIVATVGALVLGGCAVLVGLGLRRLASRIDGVAER